MKLVFFPQLFIISYCMKSSISSGWQQQRFQMPGASVVVVVVVVVVCVCLCVCGGGNWAGVSKQLASESKRKQSTSLQQEEIRGI